MSIKPMSKIDFGRSLLAIRLLTRFDTVSIPPNISGEVPEKYPAVVNFCVKFSTHMNYPPRRPRFDRRFAVTLYFPDYRFQADAINPSSTGVTVEISAPAYDYLKTHPALWENNRRFRISTSLNDLPASINSVFQNDEKFYLSVKLLDNRTWYS